MLAQDRGIVIKVGDGWLTILTDRGPWSVDVPDHDIQVGEWVDCSGGGFLGLYMAWRLAVFA
jgi:hypothetical protein